MEYDESSRIGAGCCRDAVGVRCSRVQCKASPNAVARQTTPFITRQKMGLRKIAGGSFYGQISPNQRESVMQPFDRQAKQKPSRRLSRVYFRLKAHLLSSSAVDQSQQNAGKLSSACSNVGWPSFLLDFRTKHRAWPGNTSSPAAGKA